MVKVDPGAGSKMEKPMRGIALFALFALAVACGKEEATPDKGDSGMKTPDMNKSVDDVNKAAKDAGMPSVEMRTVTLSIEGMS